MFYNNNNFVIVFFLEKIRTYNHNDLSHIER